MKPEFQNALMAAPLGVVITAKLHTETTMFSKLRSFDGSGGLISILHTNGSGGFYRLQAEVP